MHKIKNEKPFTKENKIHLEDKICNYDCEPDGNGGMSLILALWMQRQVNLCDRGQFFYRVGSRNLGLFHRQTLS